MISDQTGSRRHKKADFWTAIWAGFIGGNIASFVKWGSEIPLPPRTPDRVSPPAQMLRDCGLPIDKIVYFYAQHVVNLGVLLVHHAFSIIFAMAYCLSCLRFPRLSLWQGAAFGLVVTVGFHGIVLPLGHWAPPFWQLPFSEIFSESLGHILWAWVIEVFRRYAFMSRRMDYAEPVNREGQVIRHLFREHPLHS